MEILKSAFYFFSVLSILIIVHEWGHFFVAKLCKMRVEDFSLFFGKRLFRLGVRNGTEYNIRAIPLGGFVKISGMEPDDISNGAPIFKRKGSRRKRDIHLSGLRPEALEGIDTDNLSDRIHETVERSIGPDNQLTESGQRELQGLLHSSAINADEHRYIEAVLGSLMYEPDPESYNQKPLWQRAAVIFAGPFMSLFFGYVLFCMMGFMTGLPEMHSDTLLEVVPADRPAAKAGIKAGDRVLEINGSPVKDGDAMIETIHANPNRALQIVVQRAQERLTFTVTSYQDVRPTIENGQVVRKSVGLIGVGPKAIKVWKRYSLGESVVRGTEIMGIFFQTTIQTIFSKRVSENVGGPIAIVNQIHNDSKQGLRDLMLTAASLSISLGIFNLLPIPILDGGHLLLLTVEGIRRRKLSMREMATAQMIGLSLIGVLFVLVMYNDIVRVLLKGGKP